MQNELGADVDVSSFQHRAFYNEGLCRVEMHLESQSEQEIAVDNEIYPIALGETIHTENSYKYHLDDFSDLAAQAGFHVEQVWVDDDALFSVQCLVVE